MEWIKSINLSTAAAFLVGVWAAIKQADAWLSEHRQTIDAIVLRVEKDAQDGWTNREKTEFAKDIYKKYVEKEVKWYVRPLVKLFILPKIEKLIKTLCTKSHELKETTAEN